VSVALKVLLQLADQNIRQLTDIASPPAGRRANTCQRGAAVWACEAVIPSVLKAIIPSTCEALA
jgi:hypothetical protein